MCRKRIGSETMLYALKNKQFIVQIPNIESFNRVKAIIQNSYEIE